MSRPIIFDFDGVIVDSEVIANRAMAECLTANGFPTTPEESIARYSGMRMADCIAAIERIHRRKPPPDFADIYRTHSFALFRDHLKPVPGAAAFIRARPHGQIAIASSSGHSRIKQKLELIGLHEHFDGRIFSAADIERGKPHPDIFLKAAEGLAAEPRNCIVIEDGVLGVEGAVAAGMTVIGLTAATHCGPEHGHALTRAGAHAVATSYDEVASYIARL